MTFQMTNTFCFLKKEIHVKNTGQLDPTLTAIWLTWPVSSPLKMTCFNPNLYLTNNLTRIQPDPAYLPCLILLNSHGEVEIVGTTIEKKKKTLLLSLLYGFSIQNFAKSLVIKLIFFFCSAKKKKKKKKKTN